MEVAKTSLRQTSYIKSAQRAIFIVFVGSTFCAALHLTNAVGKGAE